MRLKIAIDRRKMERDELVNELNSLQASISGLKTAFIESEAFEAARDAGKFRDFSPVAAVSHDDRAVLEWLAEELVDQYGWLIDVSWDD